MTVGFTNYVIPAPGRCPERFSAAVWIPAYAGMTTKSEGDESLAKLISFDIDGPLEPATRRVRSPWRGCGMRWSSLLIGSCSDRP